jgi:hypothetical protein
MLSEISKSQLTRFSKFSCQGSGIGLYGVWLLIVISFLFGVMKIFCNYIVVKYTSVNPLKSSTNYTLELDEFYSM